MQQSKSAAQLGIFVRGILLKFDISELFVSLIPIKALQKKNIFLKHCCNLLSGYGSNKINLCGK